MHESPALARALRRGRHLLRVVAFVILRATSLSSKVTGI